MNECKVYFTNGVLRGCWLVVKTDKKLVPGMDINVKLKGRVSVGGGDVVKLRLKLVYRVSYVYVGNTWADAGLVHTSSKGINNELIE